MGDILATVIVHKIRSRVGGKGGSKKSNNFVDVIYGGSLTVLSLLFSFRGEDEHVKLKDFLLTNSAVLHANHF